MTYNQQELFDEDSIPHKQLTDQDLHDFSNAQMRVFDLMKDGNWHSASAIIGVSRVRSGMRVMRSLRSDGWVISKYRKPKSREWFYRLHITKNKNQNQ